MTAELDHAAPPVLVHDEARVRTLTLNRPDALNACNEAVYDALTEGFLAAADDPGVAVVLLTGEGRAFCAGTDLVEMAARVMDPDNFVEGEHGFLGLIDALTAFPKPLVIAVNGLGLGIGAMATVARRIGEEDPDGAAHAAAQALYIGAAASVALVAGLAGGRARADLTTGDNKKPPAPRPMARMSPSLKRMLWPLAEERNISSPFSTSNAEMSSSPFWSLMAIRPERRTSWNATASTFLATPCLVII